MDKKVVFGAAAILTFFVGAIWVSEVPVVATLVAFLELAAGCFYGFFLKKRLDEDVIQDLEDEIASLKKAQKAVKKEKAVTKK